MTTRSARLSRLFAPRTVRPGLLGLVVTLAVLSQSSVRGEDLLMEIGDAYAMRGDGGWSIGTAGIRYVIADDGGSIGASALENPVGEVDWLRSRSSDSTVTINGQRVSIGGALTRFQQASVSEYNGGVRLDLTFVLRSPAEEIVDDFNRRYGDRRSPGPNTGSPVAIKRSYVVYPGAAVVEMWTSFHATGTADVTLSDLTVFSFGLRPGVLHWINGLNATSDEGGPFTRFSDELLDGQRFTLGSDRRATEEHMPFFSLQQGDDEFFATLAWSGSWALGLDRRDDVVLAKFGLPPLSTVVPAGGVLETPHAVMGVTSALYPEVQQALRQYVDLGLRQGRPIRSFVSYNTWFNYGTFTDEASMLAEMELAASLGIEQFVLDAGWWLHINPDDQGDYLRNWGNWEPDLERFPNGLGWLADEARARGLRFGIWVEPERVDLQTVGRGKGVPERALAKQGGTYLPGVADAEAWSAQVCLVDREARAWAASRLIELIDEVHPDYIVWDNNLWVNCDRPGHGHGATDGNFRHHQALAGLLDEIRARFPEIDIENCATGGNRLSLDMVARSDTGWVDDRTEPSSRVRHSFGGAATLFPPSYLLSFLLVTTEGIDGVQTGDVNYVLRSRMVGSWGFSMFLSRLDAESQAAVARQIAAFKEIRPILVAGTPLLIGAPAPAPGQTGDGWDAIQYVTPGSREALLLAYSAHDAPSLATVRLKGLSPAMTYRVTSLDAGFLGVRTGADLMGIGISLQGVSDAATGHVIVIRAEQP